MNGTTSPTIVEGTVEAANDRGIKLRGSWLNCSKWRPLELPAQGAQVRCSVDLKGFLISVEILEQPASPPISRDQTITRLAVLKAAAIFCAHYSHTHEDVRSSDVLRIADAWLAWVERVEPEPEF